MRYVSLDLETGGLDRENCQILEVAAILKDAEKKEQYFECPRLRFLVRPSGPGGTYAVQAGAAAFHAELFREIAQTPAVNLIPENMVNKIIMDWCAKHGLTDNVTFAGKNFATFDLDFLLQRGSEFLGVLKYHRRILDPGSRWAFPSDSVMPNTSDCMERAQLYPSPPHTALGDAWDVIRLIQKSWGDDSVKAEPPCSERAEWIRGAWTGFRIQP